MAHPIHASFDVSGSVVKVSFTNGETLTFDTNDEANTGLFEQAALGVATAIRNAYVKAETTEDAYKMASRRLASIVDGSWHPGVRSPSNSHRASTYDDVTLALAEHFGKTPQEVTDKWMVNYLEDAYQNSGLVRTASNGRVYGKAAAKEQAYEKLRNHPDLSPILAKMASERAKAARKNEGDNGLTLDRFAA